MMLSIFAAATGAALARMAISNYYERKRTRGEIVMVRNRQGRLVDKAGIFERRMLFGYLAVMITVFALGYTILLNYRLERPVVYTTLPPAPPAPPQTSQTAPVPYAAEPAPHQNTPADGPQ